MKADVLVLATHPDDAEIGCGGTILRLTDAGRSVVVVDMTRGEKATRGTPEGRSSECARSTELLGIADRVNLGLPDAEIADDDRALRAVVGVLREFQPEIFLAPHSKDAHPDHEATAAVGRRAFFHAGLKNVLPELGAAHRPGLMLQYFGNDLAEPSVCVDIGDVVDRKRAAIESYASQLSRTAAEKTHFLRGSDPLERCEARDRYFGSMCGFEAAEPFAIDGPLPLADLAALLPV